jgi:hypothetical protein
MKSFFFHYFKEYLVFFQYIIFKKNKIQSFVNIIMLKLYIKKMSKLSHLKKFQISFLCFYYLVII